MAVDVLQGQCSPAQRSQLAGAAPGVVGDSKVGDGDEIQAFREILELVVVQVQRFDGCHSGESTLRELGEEMQKAGVFHRLTIIKYLLTNAVAPAHFCLILCMHCASVKISSIF